jgi:hypothetical protein
MQRYPWLSTKKYQKPSFDWSACSDQKFTATKIIRHGKLSDWCRFANPYEIGLREIDPGFHASWYVEGIGLHAPHPNVRRRTWTIRGGDDDRICAVEARSTRWRRDNRGGAGDVGVKRRRRDVKGADTGERGGLDAVGKIGAGGVGWSGPLGRVQSARLNGTQWRTTKVGRT